MLAEQRLEVVDGDIGLRVEQIDLADDAALNLLPGGLAFGIPVAARRFEFLAPLGQLLVLALLLRLARRKDRVKLLLGILDGKCC